MSENQEFIGKPVYGNEGKNQRPNTANSNWSVDTVGVHPYRILPPFGLLASKGFWAKYEAVHWGYCASTGRQRPFRCIQKRNWKTKMTEVECPMCTEIAKTKLMKEKRESQLKDQGKTKMDLLADEQLQMLTDWLKKYNLQKGWYLNVLRPDGQIGRLRIKTSHKQSLDAALKKLREEGEPDAIAADAGVWLDFHREGTGFNDTTYTVEPVYETITMENGKRVKSLKLAPLSEEVIKRMKTEAFELMNGFKELTSEQISMIIGSGGDPSIVDSLFGAPTISNVKEEALPDPEMAPPEEDDVPTPAAPRTVNSEAAAMAAFAKTRTMAKSVDDDDSDISSFMSKYSNKQ